MNDGSSTAVGVLNDSETSQSTGISASAMTTKFATPQPTFCRGVVVTAAIGDSPASGICARGRGPEASDEDDGDDGDADEDEHRKGRDDPQVERVEQVVVAQDRPGSGVVGSGGQDVDVVEDPERVERPEQQRDQDGRLHQGQRDFGEGRPGGGPVNLAGLK